MLVVAAVLVVFDFQNLLSWWGGRTIKPAAEASSDFTVLWPFSAPPRYFDRRADLLGYQGNVLVALEVSAPIMADFAHELEREGWRVERLVLPDPNPAELLKAALPAVTTTYTFRLDADTPLGDDVARAVAAVPASGGELCSTKVGGAHPANNLP